MAINIWLTIPACQVVVRFMRAPLIQSFFWANSQGTGRTVATRGIPPGAGRPFCQKAHFPSSRPLNRMSVSSHLESREVLSSVLETGQLAFLRAQQLRSEKELKSFLELNFRRSPLPLPSSHAVQASQFPSVQGRLEESKHWYLWVMGSYFLVRVHFTNFET